MKQGTEAADRKATLERDAQRITLVHLASTTRRPWTPASPPRRTYRKTALASGRCGVLGPPAALLLGGRAERASQPLSQRGTRAAATISDTRALDCDEGGPPRWDAQRVTEERARGGPSSCCTLDWI